MDVDRTVQTFGIWWMSELGIYSFRRIGYVNATVDVRNKTAF